MTTRKTKRTGTRAREDLTGQRFSRLTVLRPTDSVGGKTAWLCRCDCGREITVRTTQLRGGHVKTCGSPACGGGMDINRRLTYVDGTCVEMLRAKTVRSNNTSGVPGVDWLARRQRWRASICFKGKRHYLGSYTSLQEAADARKRGEETFHDQFLREFTQSGRQADAG